MKKLLSVISGVLLCSFVLSGFTTPGNTKTTSATAPRYHHSKGQHSKWVNPFTNSHLFIYNHWAANVDVAYVKYGHRPEDPIIPYTNIPSGEQGGSDLSYNDYYGTLVININVQGDSQTGNRSIVIEDFSGTRHCQTITGSGEYTFTNLAWLTQQGIWIYIETTNCD
jgi:hypothetical protein